MLQVLQGSELRDAEGKAGGFDVLDRRGYDSITLEFGLIGYALIFQTALHSYSWDNTKTKTEKNTTDTMMCRLITVYFFLC